MNIKKIEDFLFSVIMNKIFFHQNLYRRVKISHT